MNGKDGFNVSIGGVSAANLQAKATITCLDCGHVHEMTTRSFSWSKCDKCGGTRCSISMGRPVKPVGMEFEE